MAPMKPKQQEMFESNQTEEPICIYTDGAGARPDGKGSGYAFFRMDTGEKQVLREEGRTNNQAEYKAIILALETLPKGFAVEIRSDSQVACEQLNGRYKTHDPALVLLRDSVLEIIQRKNLRATFVWVPREVNLAGKLL
jgi:ribonuclease HI